MAKSKSNDAEATVASVEAQEQTTADKVQETEDQKASTSDTGSAEYDYVVIQRFKDKNTPDSDPKYFEVGDTVNRFGEERLNDLTTRGLVERIIKQ